MTEVAIWTALLLLLASPLVVPAFRRTHWRTEWWKWVVGVLLVAGGIWAAVAVG